MKSSKLCQPKTKSKLLPKKNYQKSKNREKLYHKFQKKNIKNTLSFTADGKTIILIYYFINFNLKKYHTKYI